MKTWKCAEGSRELLILLISGHGRSKVFVREIGIQSPLFGHLSTLKMYECHCIR